MRHLGLSEVAPRPSAARMPSRRVADLQIEYSLMSRGVEQRILPCCASWASAWTAYGVLSPRPHRRPAARDRWRHGRPHAAPFRRKLRAQPPPGRSPRRAGGRARRHVQPARLRLGGGAGRGHRPPRRHHPPPSASTKRSMRSTSSSPRQTSPPSPKRYPPKPGRRHALRCAPDGDARFGALNREIAPSTWRFPPSSVRGEEGLKPSAEDPSRTTLACAGPRPFETALQLAASAPPQGERELLSRQYPYSSTDTAFSSVYASTPACPFSRPQPLAL